MPVYRKIVQISDNSWMPKVGFSLSGEDMALLGTQFLVSDPRSLPNLLRSVPDEAAVETVEFAYQVNAPLTRRDLWVRCCECECDRKHKNGVVLRLVGGARVTVGRDCGREEHSLDVDQLLKEFDIRRHRARLLRQTITMLGVAPAIHDFLRRMRADSSVAASHTIRQEIARKLPELSRRLRGALDGMIKGKVKVRNLEAERQRDERLERKLESLAVRKGLSRDAADTDQALLGELVASGDKDASKEPINRLKERDVHRFRGPGFFAFLPQAAFAAERLEQRLRACFAELEGKESKAVTGRRIEIIRKDFFKVLDDAEKLHGDIAAALAFVEPANVAGIVRMTNKFYRADDPKVVEWEGGFLRKASAREDTSVEVSLPAFELATSALGKARDTVINAYSGDGTVPS